VCAACTPVVLSLVLQLPPSSRSARRRAHPLFCLLCACARPPLCPQLKHRPLFAIALTLPECGLLAGCAAALAAWITPHDNKPRGPRARVTPTSSACCCAAPCMCFPFLPLPWGMLVCWTPVEVQSLLLVPACLCVARAGLSLRPYQLTLTADACCCTYVHMCVRWHGAYTHLSPSADCSAWHAVCGFALQKEPSLGVLRSMMMCCGCADKRALHMTAEDTCVLRRQRAAPRLIPKPFSLVCMCLTSSVGRGA
jgi:hypothetical protein